MGPTIEFRGLTKRFASTTAVDDLTANVPTGSVTALLGPNGAGKTTTLRMLLGLVAPTSGAATIGGRRYADLREPAREVGAMLEASGFHPGRTALDHLRALSCAARLPDTAPDRVLDEVGLTVDGGRRVGEYSLGMRQRLGLAAALLGDPPALVLDEPNNGLDPQGIRWLRGYLRGLADEGRTVLVSSHALAEVEQIADDVIVVARGRLVRAATLNQLRAEAGIGATVRSADDERLKDLLETAGYRVRTTAGNGLIVDADPEVVGELAAGHGVALHRLYETGSLEEAFFKLTEETQP